MNMFKRKSIAVVHHIDADPLLIGHFKYVDGDFLRFPSWGDFFLALDMGAKFDLLMIDVFENRDIVEILNYIGIVNIPVFIATNQKKWSNNLVSNYLFPRHILIDSCDFEINEWELEARLDSLLRKIILKNSETYGSIWGAYEFLDSRRTVLYHGQDLFLQPKEYELALEFFLNENSVLSRDYLLRKFWGADYVGRGSLAFYISRIRKKLKLNGGDNYCLQTIYGSGFRLVSSYLV